MGGRPERRPGPIRRLCRGLALVLIAVAPTACVRYRSAPLPQPTELAPAPELTRIAIAAAELSHPTLPPLAVDLDDGLSPDEAAVLAVLANPDLAALRLTHDEAAAQLVVAGLLPAPVLSYERDRPYGDGSAGTVDATNLGLELDLASLISRSARVAEADATLAAVDLGIAWQEWQVAQAARLAALRIGWITRRIAVADAELGAETRTLAALQAALQQRDATITDIGVQLAAVESLERSRDDLRRSRIEACGELARLLGLAGGDPPTITLGDDPTGAAPLDGPRLTRTAVAGRLDLLALRYGYDAQEAVVRQAVLAQLPSLSVGVVSQRNETDLKFLGGYVTLGLPFLGEARAVIHREEATRSRLERELAARTAAVESEIHTLLAVVGELDHQLERARAAVDRLSPVAAAQRAAAMRGDVDRLSEQVARTALADARLYRAALGQARAETLAGITTVVGRPLDRLPADDQGDNP